MELFAALLVTWLVARLLAHTATHRGSSVPRLALAYVWASQLAFLCTYALDWGYSSVEASPWSLLERGHLSLLIPAAFSLAVVVVVPVLRTRGTVPALFGAAMQGLSLIPVLLWVMRAADMSFLSPGAVVAVALSASSALAALSPLMAYAATRPGKVRDIAYRDRARVVDYLSEARERWHEPRWEAPCTLLDAGRLGGRVGERTLSIDTLPRMWPLAYRVCARLELHLAAAPDAPRSDWMVLPMDRPPAWSDAWKHLHIPRAAFVLDDGTMMGLYARDVAGSDHAPDVETVRALGRALETLDACFLLCTADRLEYREVSPVGLRFDVEREAALITLAGELEAQALP